MFKVGTYRWNTMCISALLPLFWGEVLTKYVMHREQLIPQFLLKF